jgi:hypothetical protein
MAIARAGSRASWRRVSEATGRGNTLSDTCTITPRVPIDPAIRRETS